MRDDTKNGCVADYGGGGLISNTFVVGGGLFNLATTTVSVRYKELECGVEKLKYEKLEIMQLRIKSKSEVPVGE